MKIVLLLVCIIIIIIISLIVGIVGIIQNNEKMYNESFIVFGISIGILLLYIIISYMKSRRLKLENWKNAKTRRLVV